jgi:hypothetical protein
MWDYNPAIKYNVTHELSVCGCTTESHYGHSLHYVIKC